MVSPVVALLVAWKPGNAPCHPLSSAFVRHPNHRIPPVRWLAVFTVSHRCPRSIVPKNVAPAVYAARNSHPVRGGDALAVRWKDVTMEVPIRVIRTHTPAACSAPEIAAPPELVTVPPTF